MNVFVLDLDPAVAARYHNDAHVRKMIVESGQILSSALRANGVQSSILYKETHKNHPCTRLAATNRSNFLWVLTLMEELGREYTHRSGKTHKSMGIVSEIHRHQYVIPDGSNLGFVQAMPDKYKSPDTVMAYRDYYKNEKKFMKDGRLMEVYTNRATPDFLKDNQ